MRKGITFPVVAAVLGGLVLFACAQGQKRYSLPARHPETLPERGPNCLDCHERSDGQTVFAEYVHTPDWMGVHRTRAYQNQQICSLCHQDSFCNDCHVTRSELKPSLKEQTDTYRRMPHRGDYLSRHRIDGRVDPTSCFRCHGNPKSSETCVRCHG